MLIRFCFLLVIMFTLFAVFFIVGSEPISIVLFPFTDQRELPLYAALWVFFIYGVLAAYVYSLIDLSMLTRDNRTLKKEKATLEKEVAALRDLMVTEPEE